MKKTLCLFLSLAIIFSIEVPVFAAEITREDVSISEAANDPSFDPIMAQEQITQIMPRATTWVAWGDSSYSQTTNLYTPIGYSHEISGTTVLDTYHYTRTFLGSSLDPRGDSGRVWGTYTVQATGTGVISDVWYDYVHRVYYGTT